MNDDELKSLLERAEAGLEMPTLVPGELAGRVRRLDEQRRRRARMLAIAAPLAVLATAAVGWSLLGGRVDPANRGENAALDRKEIERLEAEADHHERVAREMIAIANRERTLQAARAAATESDPLDDIREQVDVVAYRMILRADDLQVRMIQSAEAVELYRQVLRLFPKTYSAEVARRRLMTLGAQEGEA